MKVALRTQSVGHYRNVAGCWLGLLEYDDTGKAGAESHSGAIETVDLAIHVVHATLCSLALVLDIDFSLEHVSDFVLIQLLGNGVGHGDGGERLIVRERCTARAQARKLVVGKDKVKVYRGEVVD